VYKRDYTETSKHEITDNCIATAIVYCDSITEVSNDDVIQYVGIYSAGAQ